MIEMSSTIPTCDQCSRTFSKKANLVRHCQKFHGLTRSSKLTFCALCSSDVESKLFETHCESEHSLIIHHQKIKFANNQDFSEWKATIENDTCSFFVNKQGKKYNENGFTQTYTCNKSGQFKSQGKGERKLRRKGSRKTGVYCPASIRISVNELGVHEVDFCSSHIGHQNDSVHLNIPKKDRENLRRKLDEGISRVRILRDISNMTDELEESQLKPINLVTDKDLSNICQKYAINNTNRSDSNDFLSVKSWVATKLGENPSIILYYKTNMRKIKIID
ncbi:uncharacterized protein LOC141851566 [Brevipalpus obovatus]|uniref:uncharacterized protein LOC141851566 n=1 Tax=Brevipalpus obovatus TaxID=246614 RepID=UPI003D9EC302